MSSPDFSLKAKQLIADTVRKVARQDRIDAAGGQFVSIPRLTVLVKVTDKYTGKGYYKGKAYVPGPQDLVPTTDLVESNLGTATVGEVIVVNVAELNGGVALSVGDFVSGFLYQVNSSTGGNKPIVLVGEPQSHPQYQFMVLQGVSQNQSGWDFQRAHAIFNP